jgi:hypothetical protein
MGDVLADYVEAGGKVILGLWSVQGAGQYNYLQGRLVEEYSPVIYTDDTVWAGGANLSGGSDCIHEGVGGYGNGVFDRIAALAPDAWSDGTYTSDDVDGAISVAYRHDRSVYYLSGFAGRGQEGYGDWPQLIANICRCAPVELYGACCDPSDGTCTDGVEVLDCQPPLEWTYDTLCADLDPGCGLPGACCDEVTGICAETVFAQCAGRFIPGEDCSTAVFDPPCGQYQGCLHSITLYDENPPHYGWFGWVDASLDVYVGGLPRYFGLTLVEGEGSKTLYFDAAEGEEITTVWHKGRYDGAWDHLAAYCIRGLDGTTLACDGEGSYERPTGITAYGSCVELECGNGNCQLEGGESCADCPQDCGTCRCVSQPSLHEEGGYLSDLDCQACSTSTLQIMADNFELFETTRITAVQFFGSYMPDDTPPAADAFTIIVREDLMGWPAADIAAFGPLAGTRAPLGGGEYQHDVSLGLTLDPGVYWLEIYNNTVNNTDTWGWQPGTVDMPFGIPGVAYSTALPYDWRIAGSIDLAFELTCESLLPGDLNCDGVVDFADINPFVLIITDPDAWQAAYPDCPLLNGDLNRNGSVGFEDINPFVALLTG